MNARSITFELSMEGSQVDEVVSSIFHTVLFHRSCGKFTYNSEESYSIRTVGYVDVDCDFVDVTYVCCASGALGRRVRRDVGEFSALLRAADAAAAPQPAHGTISLEFFQRRRARWPFQPECVPWEVWTVCCEVRDADHPAPPATHKHESVAEMLQDKILFVTEIINRHEYVPKMPSRSDVDLIFDTSYADIQPYLFKVQYSLAGAPPSTVTNTVRKLLRDKFAL